MPLRRFALVASILAVTLAGAGAAQAAPPKAPASRELAALADRGRLTSAVTTGEKMTCLGLWSALKAWVPDHGLQGLPDDFGKALPKRVAAWEKLTTRAYKANDDLRSFKADYTASLSAANKRLLAGDLRWIADWGGSCSRLPES